MDGETYNRRVNVSGKFPAFDWPAPAPTKFFSKGFWAVALFGGIGLAMSLGLSHASPCTGIDLNAGCVPIELTGQVAQ